MILPTKHISPEYSLVGAGGAVLKNLKKPCTVSFLWEQTKSNPVIDNFERFILTLDMLQIIGLVTFSEGLLLKMSGDKLKKDFG